VSSAGCVAVSGPRLELSDSALEVGNALFEGAGVPVNPLAFLREEKIRTNQLKRNPTPVDIRPLVWSRTCHIQRLPCGNWSRWGTHCRTANVSDRPRLTGCFKDRLLDLTLEVRGVLAYSLLPPLTAGTCRPAALPRITLARGGRRGRVLRRVHAGYVSVDYTNNERIVGIPASHTHHLSRGRIERRESSSRRP